MDPILRAPTAVPPTIVPVTSFAALSRVTLIGFELEDG
jgi:hypothetical protein